MKKKGLIILLFVSLMCHAGLVSGQNSNVETSEQKAERMRWWNEARFGMFIHWGLYSVPAGIWDGKDVPFLGEWIMNSAKISVADYARVAKQFNPTKYNAAHWVKLAKEAGMKYIVITTKHHDGFALFKSVASDFNVVDATPFKRDIIKELADACKKYNMKLGFYYSQSQDWHHPGGAADRGRWDEVQEGNMDTYIDKVSVPQVKELLTKYGPVSVFWFDTPAAMNKERAEKFLPILQSQPNIIINNRLGGGISGDLETPEQFIPATGYPGKNWESCMTINDTWGYKKNDQNWKSAAVLIRNLIDIASKGGNYLLNVGPTQEGLIPDSSITRLKAIGKWMKTNSVAIYGTQPSPFPYIRWGRCTKKDNTLYFSVFEWPDNGELSIPMNATINKAYLLSNPSISLNTKTLEGRVSISLPARAPDNIATVIAVETKGEIVVQPAASEGKQYRASSVKKESNIQNAFDNKGETRWEASDEDRDVWLEIDLGKPMNISATYIQETEVWDRPILSHRLEYKTGNEWKIIFEGKKIGTGTLKSFPTVRAQQFRVKIPTAQKAPFLSEFKLYQD